MTGGNLGDDPEPGTKQLVLLIDNDVDSRRLMRQMLELRGMEVVQAATGLAALELIQRLPQSFRLLLLEMDLPGLPGGVVAETLRLFRPDLPVICMYGAKTPAEVARAKGCLSKPIQATELDAALAGIQQGWSPIGTDLFSEAATARARQRFAVMGDLVEAALELARGADREPSG